MKTVDNVRDFLVLLKNTELEELTWQAQHPGKLAYKIFCGLNAAAELHVPGFESLKNKWVIKSNLALGTVTAIKRVQGVVATVFTNAKDLMDVIDIYTKLITPKYPLMFPNCDNSEESMKGLYKWSKELGLFVIQEPAGVKITNEHSDSVYIPIAG